MYFFGFLSCACQVQMAWTFLSLTQSLFVGEQAGIHQIEEEIHAFHMSPKTQQLIKKPAFPGPSLIQSCSSLVMWWIEHSRTRIVKMYPRRREHEAIRALPGIAIVLMCQLVGVCLEVGIAWFCYPVFSIHRLPDQHVIYDSFLINFASSSLHSNNFKLISEKPHFIPKTTQVLLQSKRVSYKTKRMSPC